MPCTNPNPSRPIHQKRPRGAPKGNTNAVKHGRNSRVRAPVFALFQMIQREYPEWIADPRQIPEPVAALFITLGDRLSAVEEAAQRRQQKNPLSNIPKGLLQDAADLQARFAELGYNFPPFDAEQQTTNINSAAPLAAGGEGLGEGFNAEQQTTKIYSAAPLPAGGEGLGEGFNAEQLTTNNNSADESPSPWLGEGLGERFDAGQQTTIPRPPSR